MYQNYQNLFVTAFVNPRYLFAARKPDLRYPEASGVSFLRRSASSLAILMVVSLFN